MSLFHKILISLLLLACGHQAFAQKNDSSSFFIKKESLLALPIVFYTPETRLAGGLAGLFAFRPTDADSGTQVSNIQIGGAYTQENQLLLYLPWRIYTSGNDYLSFGEVGYYRYRFYFYGIGNHNPEFEGELYDIVFPRLRLNFLKEVGDNHHLGLYYGFDDYVLSNFEPGGLLANMAENIPGRMGGRQSVLGLIEVLDRRDVQFFPEKGFFHEGGIQFSHSAIGSEYNFVRFYSDLRIYKKAYKNHILAINTYLEGVWGEAPFLSMAQLGGNKRMRGYYEGRFRDQKLALLQLEYRLPLFWRFKLALFGSLGGVAPEISAFRPDNFHHAYGAGLRFLLNKDEKIHVRLDYGRGEKQNSGFYLTVGEAF